MDIHILNDAQQLGEAAAERAAATLNAAIAERGTARLVVSTGASQFTTIDALVRQDVDWSKVEMFHLDEYIGIAPTHPASFIRYLNERLVSKVSFKAVNFVDPAIGAQRAIDELTAKIRLSPVDLGLIGIGENAHLAFNDPPADFQTQDAYIVVTLDQACREQQVGEGWFKTLVEVPDQAISMSVHQILQCRHIISSVPHATKAHAVASLTAAREPDPFVPATALLTHPRVDLFLDLESAASADKGI